MYRVEDFVEAKILGEKMIDLIFKSNTISSTGKNELAKLVGGLTGYPINRMWVVIGGTVNTITPSLTRTDNTLTVKTPTPFTTAGTYSAVLTGSSQYGPNTFYNSIPISVVLSSGSSLDISVHWVFSGAASNAVGNRVCASRFGNISDEYNYPVSTIAFNTGTESVPNWTDPQALSNSVPTGSNTLYCYLTSPKTGPYTFCGLAYRTSNTISYAFDFIEGFTISIGSGQTLDIESRFAFG